MAFLHGWPGVAGTRIKTVHMFSMNQILEAHGRVRSGADFPRYIRDLKAIGVTRYDTYVPDGRSVYYGSESFVLNGEPRYPSMEVNSTGSADKLKHALEIHQNGQTSYPEFCRQAAEAGVEKWTTDLLDFTVSYFDKKGSRLIVEKIPA